MRITTLKTLFKNISEISTELSMALKARRILRGRWDDLRVQLHGVIVTSQFILIPFRITPSDSKILKLKP